MKVLSAKSDEIKLLSAEVSDYEKSYYILRSTFVQLLEDYVNRRDLVGFNDAEEIRYKYMDSAGLLDI
jgi:hypothetical protein